ncbi:MAG: alpha/beta hydrolase [Pseudomonadota bacterium]|nr:alpha/beta hydrolase [Pseudomonadota bacterium]
MSLDSPQPKATMQRFLLWSLVLLVTGAVVLWLLSMLSPWPKALVIRHAFDQGAEHISQQLAKHVPAQVESELDLQYDPKDPDAFLDVFYPSETTTARPTVIWIHGGAWISGDKSHVRNYLKILAAEGYTTVAVGYSLAPRHQYPVPLHQINQALTYLQQHAQTLQIDPQQLVLAGDSAGAQIAAQVATLTTSPDYAQAVGIVPALRPDQLKGMLLSCGAYDLQMVDYNGSFGVFFDTVMRAYSGTRRYLTDVDFSRVSVLQHVTADFPPSFITAGNADPLAPHSVALAERLVSLGVDTQTLFYPADHQPALEHEYQFNLDIAAGQQALQQMLVFLARVTAEPKQQAQANTQGL